MKKSAWRGLSLAAGLTLATGLAACGGPAAQGPNGASQGAGRVALFGRPATRSGLKVIAFYDQSQSDKPPSSFTLLKSHPGLVSYLSPFWFEVGADGSVVEKPEGDVATLAAQDHLPLAPLFNNAKGTDAFLKTAALRAKAVTNIVRLVKSRHYPGLNIDFQLLKPADRSDLTAFMTMLRHQLPGSTFLSMSVIPPTASNNNGPAAAYDLGALDRVTQAMVLMAYDLHGDGTAPGPVSPISWVAQAITRTLHAGVAPAKLYLGIANYGYLWTVGSTKATTIPLKAMHQHLYGTYTWVPSQAEGTVSFTRNGKHQIIWFVPDRGAVDRINLAKQDHLGGVAFWRLGYEDAKWWDAVATALNSPAPPSRVSPQTRGA